MPWLLVRLQLVLTSHRVDNKSLLTFLDLAAGCPPQWETVLHVLRDIILGLHMLCSMHMWTGV